MGAQDVWHYNKLDENGNPAGTTWRQVTSGPDVAGHVSITDFDGGPSTTNYIVGADGLFDPYPLGNTPASAANIVGGIFEYATPLYPVGAERRHVRSGPWGRDLDGDGIGESFRFEFTQVFLGFETIQFSDVFTLNDVAHFRNVFKLTLRPTAPGYTDYTVTATEEAWFASGLGFVKALRSIVDSDGAKLDPPHALLFSSGYVDGVNWDISAPPPVFDGSLVDVALVHKSLVYDSLRNVYYASVPGSVMGAENRIATIEPMTGQVSYSAPVGSEPGALAIAADASALYVGLDGSGDVVKLALPGMTELGRAKLVSDSLFGQSHAETIAVSPTDASVAAVSMAWTSRHAGVALLRDMAMQPKRTQALATSNLVAFDATGANLYGLNNETSEYGLRRFQVLADGLVQELFVAGTPSLRTQALAFAGGRVIAGHTLYDAALSAAGVISGASDCVPRRSSALLLCLRASDSGAGQARVLIADSGTFVIKASLLYTLGEPFGAFRRLVEGPAGQIAVSYAVADAGFGSVSKIRLFSNAQLLTPPTPAAALWPVTSASTADGQALDIGIVHNSLVYDSTRNVYYASVPGSVIGSGNSIATIDAATGQVTQSAPVGSEPNQLALAADASFLYVGLDGSGDVAKLVLPSMAELGRVKLVTDSWFGPTRAESIAVSPVDSSVAAVAMAWINPFMLHHAGDALLRDMVMQPHRTQAQTGSNLVTFDSLGTKVYGMNAEGESGLRRLGILADGLVEELRVTAASTGSLPRVVSFANGQVVEGGTVFNAPDLTAVGTVSGASDCWPTRTGTGLLCLSGRSGHVLVADSVSFATIASPIFYTNTEPDFARRLVQGPAGQIGVSYIPQLATPTIRLFSSSQLP